MSVRQAGGARGAVGTSGVNAALDKAFKDMDAYISKLDGNKNGKLEEPEMKKFMKKMEKWSGKMEKAMEQAGEPTGSNRAKFMEGLNKVRTNMTDAQRMDMVVASAVSQLTDDRDMDSLPIKDIQKAARAGMEKMVKDLTTPQGGIEGAMATMFAGILLPKALFESALGHR